MMHQIGREAPVRAPDGERHPQQRDRIHAAAAPSHGVETKSFIRDRLRMRADIGDDMNVIARIPGGTRHRQPMREEVPVLCHQINERRRGWSLPTVIRGCDRPRMRVGFCSFPWTSTHYEVRS